MTDEKICPFMSKNKISYINEDGGEEVEFSPVICQKDRCMAWGKMHVIDYDNPDPDSPCIIIEGCRLIP